MAFAGGEIIFDGRKAGKIWLSDHHIESGISYTVANLPEDTGNRLKLKKW
jgi:hypothetical protein